MYQNIELYVEKYVHKYINVGISKVRNDMYTQAPTIGSSRVMIGVKQVETY